MVPCGLQRFGAAGLVTEHERRAAERGPQQSRTQAENVVKRPYPGHHVAGCKIDGAGGLGGGVQEVAVCELDPARLP